jgi:hypothetical protein
MTFLPVVERELRVAARRRSTYWSRVGAALMGLAISVYLYVATSPFGQPQLGLVLFNALAWISLLYCLVVGPRLTSDCVSAERREGTLGLLFLTDLKGYDIILGKLAASSTRAFYGLLAMFPVLGVAVLFGGVTGTQFYQVVLVLLNTLLFSLAAGVFASVWFQRWGNALGLSFLLVLAFSLGPVACFAVAWLWQGMPMSQGPVHWLVPSPGFALALAASPGVPGAPVHLFWPSVACTHVLAWLFLAGASLALPRAWRERPASTTRLHRRARWRQWCYGNGAARAAFRRRLLDVNPLFWLAARDRLKPAYVWGFLGLVAGGCLYGWLYYPDWREETELLALVSVAVHGALKLWLGTVVVHRLAEDRQSGILELILSTPLTTKELFWGQRRALLRQFGGPLVAVLAADVLFCYLSMRREYGERTFLAMLYGAHVLILLADAYAISWVGLWTAVTAKRPNHAAAAALQRVLVVPWLLFITLGIAFEILDMERRWGWDISGKQAVAIWFAIGLATDIVFLVHARLKLAHRFRTAATQLFDARRAGFLAWLFGGR